MNKNYLQDLLDNELKRRKAKVRLQELIDQFDTGGQMDDKPMPGKPPKFNSIEEANEWMAERERLETQYKAERDAIWVDTNELRTPDASQLLQQWAGSTTTSNTNHVIWNAPEVTIDAINSISIPTGVSTKLNPST